MAKTQRQLPHRRRDGAAIQQDEHGSGKAGPVGAGLAVQQRRRGRRVQRRHQGEHALARRCAAARQRHVEERQAEPGRLLARQRVRAVAGGAAQVDDAAQAVATRGGTRRPGVGWLLR